MKETFIRGVIFDLDGTLIDSYQAIYLSFRFAYKKMGLSPLTFDQVKRVVGRELGATFQELLGEEQVAEAMKFFRQEYEEVYRQNTFLLPDSREVLEELHARGVHMAVATNKLGRFSREILHHFGLDKLLEIIVGDGDVLQTKPHPAMLLYALEKMGLQKEEVVFIGDSLIDIQTAQNAGLHVFAVSTGAQTKEELEKAHPAAVLRRLGDLLHFIVKGGLPTSN